LRGDVLLYVAQGNPLIDAKIAEKRRFRTGTGYGRSKDMVSRVITHSLPPILPTARRLSD